MQATCSKLHSAQYRVIIITPSNLFAPTKEKQRVLCEVQTEQLHSAWKFQTSSNSGKTFRATRSSDTVIAQVISSAAQSNNHPNSSQATFFSSQGLLCQNEDLPCSLKFACYPVVWVSLSLYHPVWLLRSILWLENCALSCGFIIEICPVVWR
jgi:hypothetical protein